MVLVEDFTPQFSRQFQMPIFILYFGNQFLYVLSSVQFHPRFSYLFNRYF